MMVSFLILISIALGVSQMLYLAAAGKAVTEGDRGSLRASLAIGIVSFLGMAFAMIAAGYKLAGGM